MSDITENNIPTYGESGLLARLRDQYLDWRNGRVLDRRFQEWATSFWLTRPLVRQRQKALFDLTAGFVYSQVLYACVELRIFDHLKYGAVQKTDLAKLTALNIEAMALLLDAAEALDLIHIDKETVRLADLGAAVVANPGIAAMVRHHDILYRDLADPLGLLRGDVDKTELSAFWGYATNEAPDTLKRDNTDEYSHLMAVSQDMVAAEVTASYQFSQHDRVLDVGGGEGAFLKAVADVAPSIELHLFDLPAVAERAEEKMRDLGHGHRFTAHGGSFFTDELPRGTDLITLIRVCYDHDDAKVSRIMSGIFDALPKGGTLIVAEPMAGAKGAEAMGAAYFGFYLKAMQSGRARKFSELSNLAKAVGFSRVRQAQSRSPLLTSILIAHK